MGTRCIRTPVPEGHGELDRELFRSKFDSVYFGTFCLKVWQLVGELFWNWCGFLAVRSACCSIIHKSRTTSIEKWYDWPCMPNMIRRRCSKYTQNSRRLCPSFCFLVCCLVLYFVSVWSFCLAVYFCNFLLRANKNSFLQIIHVFNLFNSCIFVQFLFVRISPVVSVSFLLFLIFSRNLFCPVVFVFFLYPRFFRSAHWTVVSRSPPNFHVDRLGYGTTTTESIVLIRVHSH